VLNYNVKLYDPQKILNLVPITEIEVAPNMKKVTLRLKENIMGVSAVKVLLYG
jgi:hypothetical protein